VNFSIFSRKATAVELLLFDRADDAKPKNRGQQQGKLDLRHNLS
jgi:pullulanase/glycogen debranching enzyme